MTRCGSDAAGRRRDARVRGARFGPRPSRAGGGGGDRAVRGHAPAESPPAPDLEGAGLEERAAFSLALNAINSGSGWFPTLRKAPGMSGLRTVEAGLRAHGPWTADELAAMTREEVAAAVGQEPQHELMGHFAVHLRELG